MEFSWPLPSTESLSHRETDMTDQPPPQPPPIQQATVDEPPPPPAETPPTDSTLPAAAETPPTPPPTEPLLPAVVSPEMKAQFPNVFKSEKRQYIEDFTAHLIGIIFSVGFFAIILIALLGFVDINDPTIAAFVGTAIGYAAGKLDPVLSRYFGSMTTTGPTK